MPSPEESIRDVIAREEARLARLEEEVAESRILLESLRAQLATRLPPLPRPRSLVPPTPVPATSAEKVVLFRSRFRGREDLYPRFWSNARTGRKGYAPACANEWVRGVCEKPRVKCGECPNQAFLPVEGQVILDHLQGRHVVGVYPLLTDETCWFLAADFDKTPWTDDVAAFVETCRAAGLLVAVERSRSGNGAHVWFFFSGSVAASTARKMGCYLITETMSRRHQLSMESYDRLFPNQDTLPRGGFGNLIALPLQHGPRQRGNTVFVDDQFVPHPDQWKFLSEHPRIEPAMVARVAREATRNGLVVGVRLSDTADTDSSAPWTRPPSGPPRVQFSAPLPREVHAVLAQRLFVAKGGLAPTHLNQIKRLAAFQNPEFYKKQTLRLSTALTPRVVACAEDLPEHVALPRGCRTELEQILREHERALVVEDQRCAGKPLRNRLILDDVRTALAEGRCPILLTERKDHLESLAASLRGAARHLVVLRGGMTSTERRAAAATLAAIPDAEPRLLIATGRYVGEGFDDARLDTLFLAMPISWKGTLVQYAGRLHRLYPGKTEVRIYDYVDREVPMLARMFEKRLRGYRAIGYARGPASLTREELDGEALQFDTPAAAE